MTENVSRALSKLMPAPAYQPPQPQPAATAAPVLAQATGQQPMDSRGIIKEAGLVKNEGYASLDHGNDFDGNPIINAELRGGKLGGYAIGDVSGALSIDVSLAEVFRMRVQGNVTIQFDTSKLAAGYGPTDWERGIVLRIQSMGAYTITMPGGIWAPKNTAPTLNKAGHYEIGAAYNSSVQMGNQWYFYPINQPA